MTRYQKTWLIGFLTITIGFLICLIYAAKTSENWKEVKWKINNLTIDQIDYISIEPSNPEWKVNLTLDTIRLKDSLRISIVTNKINKIDQTYYGKALGGEWTAEMNIYLNKGEKIRLHLIDSNDGFFIKLKNTMGNHLYYCNELKEILQNFAEYKQPLGRKH